MYVHTRIKYTVQCDYCVLCFGPSNRHLCLRLADMRAECIQKYSVVAGVDLFSCAGTVVK